MVVDATIVMTVQRVAAADDGAEQPETEESLYPARHQMTLPLNGLNMLFSDCVVAFNHHTKLDSDRSGFFLISLLGGGSYGIRIVFLILYNVTGIFFSTLIPTVISLHWSKISIRPVMM